VPLAVSLWPPECTLLRSQSQRSQGNTKRRILCNFKMTILLPIAA
jgi:hypothetical protein